MKRIGTTATVPGTVLEVGVGVGDPVEEGQVLGMMEAMKMELSLKAPFAGTVTIGDAVAGRQGIEVEHLVLELDESKPLLSRRDARHAGRRHVEAHHDALKFRLGAG